LRGPRAARPAGDRVGAPRPRPHRRPRHGGALVTDTLPPPAAPEPQIDIVELPYHRLYRAQPNYRWWRPLVAVLLLVVFIVVTQVIIAVVVMVAVFASGAVEITGL